MSFFFKVTTIKLNLEMKIFCTDGVSVEAYHIVPVITCTQKFSHFFVEQNKCYTVSPIRDLDIDLIPIK